MFARLFKHIIEKPLIVSLVTLLLIALTATVSVSLSFRKLTQTYLKEKFSQTEMIWDSLMRLQKESMEICFDLMINDKKTRKLMKMASSLDKERRNQVRAELFVHVYSLFESLKKYGNLWQILFFTADNRAFLRMHAPHEYGDDLSKTRPSVVYVSTHRKPVFSFDIGYYLSGFKYVFPIFDEEGNYLGGVEIARPSHFMRNLLVETLPGFDYKILLKQEVVLSRVPSHRQLFYQPSTFGNIWLEEDPLGDLSHLSSAFNPTLQAVYSELPKSPQVLEILNSPKGGVTTVSYRDKSYIVKVIKIYDLSGKEVAALLGIGYSEFIEALSRKNVTAIYGVLLFSTLASVLLYLTLHSAQRTFVERKKAEKLIERSNLAGVFLDRRGKITYCSERFRSLFGYREEELLNQDFHSFLLRHAISKEDTSILTALDKSEELKALIKVRTLTDDEAEVEVTVMPLVEWRRNSGFIVLMQKL